jgi:hypothetical protein
MYDVNFIAHIIRDIFTNRDNTIVFGECPELLECLYSPAHSIGAYMLHTNQSNNWKPKHLYDGLKYAPTDAIKSWYIKENDSFFGANFCDLFISINYQVEDIGDPLKIVGNIKKVMKPNSIGFIVNPGSWASEVENFNVVRYDLIKEVKRYSMFRNEKVLVYENI